MTMNMELINTNSIHDCTARFTLNGEVREQLISLNGNTYEELLADFEENDRTFDGWEDGIGNAVCWENAE